MDQYYREKLNTLRTNLTLFWQTMLLTFASTLGLLFKALNDKTNFIEILLMLMGAFTVALLVYLISLISINIDNLQKELKRGLKNE